MFVHWSLWGVKFRLVGNAEKCHFPLAAMLFVLSFTFAPLRLPYFGIMPTRQCIFGYLHICLLHWPSESYPEERKKWGSLSRLLDDAFGF